MGHNVIKFIDLFAGIGGIRFGFENACRELGLVPQCVMTSEIKPSAVSVYEQNYPGSIIMGDITKIDSGDIPEFDFLLGGFPCQAFSNAGKRLGFADTRGTLFFDIARILKQKQPQGFLLENVPGLVSHDGGKTFSTILSVLEELGYHTSWAVLDATNFGVPQARRRVYIAGTRGIAPSLADFPQITAPTIASIMEHGATPHLRPTQEKLRDTLLAYYTIDEMRGMVFSNVAGLRNHTRVHSWDFGIYGIIPNDDKILLEQIALASKSRKYRPKNIFGMMPLTAEQISDIVGYDASARLNELERLGYVYQTHPKITNGSYMDDVIGYRIAMSGPFSWQIRRIIDPEGACVTITATDADRMWVPDGDTIRPLTMRECMRVFGYPDSYNFDVPSAHIGYDLVGNTVCPPVISAVALRLLEAAYGVS